MTAVAAGGLPMEAIARQCWLNELRRKRLSAVNSNYSSLAYNAGTELFLKTICGMFGLNITLITHSRLSSKQHRDANTDLQLKYYSL